MLSSGEGATTAVAMTIVPFLPTRLWPPVLHHRTTSIQNENAVTMIIEEVVVVVVVVVGGEEEAAVEGVEGGVVVVAEDPFGNRFEEDGVLRVAIAIDTRHRRIGGPIDRLRVAVATATAILILVLLLIAKPIAMP